MRRYLLLAFAASTAAADRPVDDTVTIAIVREDGFEIAQISPRGVTELLRDRRGSAQLAWIDRRTLVVKTEDDAGTTLVRYFVDAKLVPRRTVRIPRSFWKTTETPDSSLELRAGRAWLRICTDVERTPMACDRERFASLSPLALTDVEPPDAIDPRSEPADPVAAPPPDTTVEVKQIALRPWNDDRVVRANGVLCTRAGATTTWPGASDLAHKKVIGATWLSATPPIYVVETEVGGMAGIETLREYFHPCEPDPFTLRWLGKGLWLTPGESDRSTIYFQATRIGTIERVYGWDVRVAP